MSPVSHTTTACEADAWKIGVSIDGETAWVKLKSPNAVICYPVNATKDLEARLIGAISRALQGISSF